MTRMIVILGFLISLSAGVAIGLSIRKPPISGENVAPQSRPRGGGWLVDQLGLSPEQRKQLDEIWSETARRGGREQGQQRAKLRRERDEAIAALVPEADRAKYEQIHKNYDDAVKAMEESWRASFQQSVERTKAMLTPEQREKYEQLMSNPNFDRGRGPGGPGGPGGERDGPGRDGPGRDGPERGGPKPSTRPAE